MEVNNFDAKTGERIAEVKLSPEQTRMIIRILKEARHGAKQKSHP